VSRREAISAGGLALAGAASLAGAAGPAPASTSPGKILFGANRSAYSGLHAAAPLAVGLRWYFDVENDFPLAWPQPYPGAHMTLSIRPNPGDLLSGRLDSHLKALIDSAPPRSELTFWHENTSGNPLDYPPSVNNARTAIRMQKYGHMLCAGTHVLFGVITVGPVVDQLHWIAPGLDWYGDDLYEFARLRNANGTFSRTKVIARLYANLHAWQKVTGKKAPAIRICETNSRYDSHRAEFFTTIAYWMARHNGNRILTYWNRHDVGLSGPWPPSEGVIDQLQSLSKQYS
jgi:hypothetical protein